MGATNTSLILNIDLQKQTFIPGETFSGTFNFVFKEGEKKKINLKNSEVIISFSSIESTYKHPEELKSTLVASSLSIPELSKINTNPQTRIPFQAQIPMNAKQSFEFSRAKMYASFRNYLKIEIPEIKAQGIVFIIIKKLPNSLNSPLDLAENTHNKGLFSLDNVVLNVKCHTNNFPLKSQIPFTFSADFSKTKYNIKSMEFVLKRKLKFLNEDKVLEEIIDELQQKKIKGNMKKEQTENFVADLNDPQEIYKKYSMDKLLIIEGLQPNNVINFLPNIKTNLFECEYYIKVRAVTDSSLFSTLNSPSMYVPLDVFQADNYSNNFNIKQSLLYQQLPIQQSCMQSSIQNFPVQTLCIPLIQNSSTQQSYIQQPQEQFNQPTQDELFDKRKEPDELDIPTLEEIMDVQVI